MRKNQSIVFIVACEVYYAASVELLTRVFHANSRARKAAYAKPNKSDELSFLSLAYSQDKWTGFERLCGHFES